jgi:hypothetical protein
MRTILTALAIMSMAAPALADENVVGAYDVKFDLSGTTCSPDPATLKTGKVTIDIRGGSLSVQTDTVPVMHGTPQKNGKISAKTLKLMATTIGGLSARYSVAGRVESGMLQLVLTAEYVRQDTGKPYCTQAWNVAGLRADAEKK